MTHLSLYSSSGQIQDLALNFFAGNRRLLPNWPDEPKAKSFRIFRAREGLSLEDPFYVLDLAEQVFGSYFCNSLKAAARIIDDAPKIPPTGRRRWS
jgi:hypothetical protein